MHDCGMTSSSSARVMTWPTTGWGFVRAGCHAGCDPSPVWMQAIVDGLGGVLFRFPFRVPAYYALILRSLTVLEGLALQADRNYKLLGKAYPYMAKRLLIDPAPELR